jgi:RNA polymerase sigma-70 factor (ECF subfamily)
MMSGATTPREVESVVLRASTGDASAFEELYHHYCRRVYSLCVRLTGSVDDAEDLTQDVFLLVHRKLGSFRGDASFSTWLHRVTVNRALMHLRKGSVRHEQAEDQDTLRKITEAHAREHDGLSLIDRIALWRAIRNLPRGYRTVLVLHDVEGYRHDEIAALLGISVGATKSQLHKARMKVRRSLCLSHRHLPPRWPES